MTKRVKKTPYFKWRDGKPRWEPGPGLRARGLGGRDLKDAAGNWLSYGAAIDAAEKLTDAARNPQADAAVPVAAGLDAKTCARTGGNLVSLYRASPNFLRRAGSTQSGYNSHLDLFEAWAGDTLIATIAKGQIANHHMMLEETRGGSMANAWLRVVKILLYYAMDDLDWITKVKARKIEWADSEGRLVIWPMQAVLGFVRWCDWAGRPDIGDAVICGCLTGLRRADILRLPRGKEQGGIYRFKTGKTGRDVKVPAIGPLVARLAIAHERADRLFGNVAPIDDAVLTEIVDLTTGLPFHPDGSHFHKQFHALKLLAIGEHDKLKGPYRALAMIPRQRDALPFLPELADLMFMDLRDTAITWLAMAGCNKYEIATITGHSLETIDKILSKHYLVRDDAFAHSAGAKFEALLTEAKFG